MSEKFILTRQMHLGYVKDTFNRGSVIEFFPERNVLVVNGRKFTDTRDIEILKRRSLLKPDAPWIIPYTQEAYDVIRGVPAYPQAAQAPERRYDIPLPVVQSDEDSHELIDIRHTQVGKRKAEAKEAARQGIRTRDREGKLEIIKGDQTVEERIADLEGKGDMKSTAARVALKRQKAKMQVVHDDSLGMMGGGKGSISMNAGQPLPSREEGEAAMAGVESKAAGMKAQVERNRNASGVEVSSEVEGTAVVDTGQGAPAEVDFAGMVESPQEAARQAALAEQGAPVEGSDDDGGYFEAPVDSAEAENIRLRNENTQLKDTQSAILKRLEALEKPPVKRSPGRPKGAADKAKRRPRKVTKRTASPARTPVTEG